jgi:hypothetical protein
MGVYVMESVFSIQTVEELVYYLKVAEALKDQPLALEVVGKPTMIQGTSNVEIRVIFD